MLGCFEATVLPTREFTLCPRCRNDDPDCDLCEGSGTWKIFRCPSAVCEPWAMETVLLTTLAIEKNAWPQSGGLLDQTAWFMNALNFVTHVRGMADGE